MLTAHINERELSFSLFRVYRVQVGSPRPCKRTKVTSYLKRAFRVAHTRALSVFAQRGSLAMSPAFGSGSVRPKFLLCEATQSRPGRVIETSRAAAVDTQQPFSSRIELAHLRNPRVRIRPRLLDLRPPVSRLVHPSVCHFVSRRVSCVAAKATLEVGLTSLFSSLRAAVARRAPAVSLDGVTSLGVVMFDSVVLVKGCLSLN